MDERLHLLAQIDALNDNLRRASDALKSNKVDEELRALVQARFNVHIKMGLNELKSLRENVNNNLPMDSCWNSFNIIYRQCTPVFNECLDFLQGSLVRTAELDAGICKVADCLLDDLSKNTGMKWANLTILGESEFLNRTADIIRIRFPEFSIWNIPVVAHEFGHLVASDLRAPPTLGDYAPFKDMIERERGKNQQAGPFLHELFSDLFGVYSLGPAFVCTCLILYFNPLNAYKDYMTHPSNAKRAYFMLKALEKMNGEVMTKPYSHMISVLTESWDRSLTATNGEAKKLGEEDINQLDAWLEEMYRLFDTFLTDMVKYPALSSKDGWNIATICYNAWEMQIRQEKVLSSGIDLLSANEGTLRDALNAAWICRTYHPEKILEISPAAEALCRELCRTRSRPALSPRSPV